MLFAHLPASPSGPHPELIRGGGVLFLSQQFAALRFSAPQESESPTVDQRCPQEWPPHHLGTYKPLERDSFSCPQGYLAGGGCLSDDKILQ